MSHYPECEDCRWFREDPAATCHHPKVPRSVVDGRPEHFRSNPYVLRGILFLNWLRCGPRGAWFEPRDSS